MKDIKLIYETTVKKQITEPVEETREENGQTVKITRTVKKAKPIKLGILKADRKLFKMAEMFYAKSLSQYLKEGLMPFSLVAKRYANDGGPLTEREKERIKELKEEAKSLEADFYANIAESDDTSKKKKNDALIRINDINTEVNNIQNAYSDIFESTAEVKSRNDIMEWWALFLIHINVDDKGFIPLFGDGNYDEKVKKLEEIESNEDAFELESIKKLSYLTSFWFTARNAVTKIDFDAMEKLYQDTMTTYKVEEDKEDVKITEEKAT